MFLTLYIYMVELCWVDILNILLTLIYQSMDGLHQNSRFCGAIGTPICSRSLKFYVQILGEVCDVSGMEMPSTCRNYPLVN